MSRLPLGSHRRPADASLSLARSRRRARSRRTRNAAGLMPSERAAWVGVRSSQATRRRASRSTYERDRNADSSSGRAPGPRSPKPWRREPNGARPPPIGEHDVSRRCEEPWPRVVAGDVRQPPPGDRHHLGGCGLGIRVPSPPRVRGDGAEVREHGAEPFLGSESIGIGRHASRNCRQARVSLHHPDRLGFRQVRTALAHDGGRFPGLGRRSATPQRTTSL